LYSRNIKTITGSFITIVWHLHGWSGNRDCSCHRYQQFETVRKFLL